jgi:hypothetical protein
MPGTIEDIRVGDTQDDDQIAQATELKVDEDAQAGAFGQDFEPVRLATTELAADRDTAALDGEPTERTTDAAQHVGARVVQDAMGHHGVDAALVESRDAAELRTTNAADPSSNLVARHRYEGVWPKGRHQISDEVQWAEEGDDQQAGAGGDGAGSSGGDDHGGPGGPGEWSGDGDDEEDPDDQEHRGEDGGTELREYELQQELIAGRQDISEFLDVYGGALSDASYAAAMRTLAEHATGRTSPGDQLDQLNQLAARLRTEYDSVTTPKFGMEAVHDETDEVGETEEPDERAAIVQEVRELVRERGLGLSVRETIQLGIFTAGRVSEKNEEDVVAILSDKGIAAREQVEQLADRLEQAAALQARIDTLRQRLIQYRVGQFEERQRRETEEWYEE